MRSITLSSQSVLLLRPHSLPSSSKPLKSRYSYLNYRFTNQTSNLSPSNPTLSLSRYSRQQCVNMYKEFKFLNCNACKATQWMNDVDDYDGLDKSPSKKKIGGRNFIPGDVDDYNASNTPFHCYLKFILLFGLFSLGGSQQAFLLIFFFELGDKTFFIAALLPARNSSAVVFIGTFGALATMTIISVVLGRTFHYVDDILPFRFGDTDLPIDDIAAICLLG